jgi:hypothetical protein
VHAPWASHDRGRVHRGEPLRESGGHLRMQPAISPHSCGNQSVLADFTWQHVAWGHHEGDHP